MFLVDVKTEKLIDENDFYQKFNYVSFARPLTNDAVEQFDHAIVKDAPMPDVGENQYVKIDGAENINGEWTVKYAVVDYTQSEIEARLEQWRQFTTCSPFRGRTALRRAGLFSQVEAMIALPETPDEVKDAWEYAIEWRRMDPMIISLATALNMTDTQVDDLFKAAAQIAA